MALCVVEQVVMGDLGVLLELLSEVWILFGAALRDCARDGALLPLDIT